MSTEKINIKDSDYTKSCVYIIKNINNSKVYIGNSTKHYRKRMNEHRNDLEKGIHANKHLQRSFDIGNLFEFTILEKINEQELINREIYYCNSYNSYDKNIGYNLLEPSKCPRFVMTKEHLIVLQEARKAKGYDTSHLRTELSMKRATEGKYKKVLIFQKDGTFVKEGESLIDAERITGVKRQNISAVCRGIRKQVGGFTFKLKELN